MEYEQSLMSESGNLTTDKTWVSDIVDEWGDET